MAIVKGVNRTKLLDPYGNNILDPGLISGRIRTITDTYEAVILASGSTIEMGTQLPAGAIVIGGKLSFDALGTPCAWLEVGDEGDADRYMAVTQTSSAALMVLPDLIGGMNYVVTGTTDNILKITTTLGSASGTIKLETMYIVD